MTLFPQAFRYGFSRIHQTLVKLTNSCNRIARNTEISKKKKKNSKIAKLKTSDSEVLNKSNSDKSPGFAFSLCHHHNCIKIGKNIH